MSTIDCTAISSQNASSSAVAATFSGTNKIEVVSLDHQSCLFWCFFYSLVSVHNKVRLPRAYNGIVVWRTLFMSDTLKELEQQARALSPEERARLADVLLESLRDAPLTEIEAAWEREIEERAAAYDRGELPTFSAEEVFAEARRLAR
jgi:putative addiction module component (TIGR02574 family)